MEEENIGGKHKISIIKGRKQEYEEKMKSMRERVKKWVNRRRKSRKGRKKQERKKKADAADMTEEEQMRLGNRMREESRKRIWTGGKWKGFGGKAKKQRRNKTRSWERDEVRSIIGGHRLPPVGLMDPP